MALFYGWVVVGAAVVSHFLSYGTEVVAFGLFPVLERVHAVQAAVRDLGCT